MLCYKCSAVAEIGDRLATIGRHQPKRGGGCAPFGGGLGPHLTQCGQERGLPPYQVASWSIHPFGHNRHGPKIGGCAPLGGARSPSNTMWPRPRPISMPSFVLIHPTVWPQYTNVTDRQDRQTDRQRSDSIWRTVLQTVDQNDRTDHQTSSNQHCIVAYRRALSLVFLYAKASDEIPVNSPQCERQIRTGYRKNRRYWTNISLYL